MYERKIIFLLVDGIRTSEIYLEMTTETMTYIWEVVQKSQSRGRHWRKQEEGTRSTRSKAGNRKQSQSRSRSPPPEELGEE